MRGSAGRLICIIVYPGECRYDYLHSGRQPSIKEICQVLNFLLPNKVSDDVRTEQIRLVHHQGITTQSLGIITAIVCLVFFWRVVDHVTLSVWFAVILVLSVIRIVVTSSFNKRKISDYSSIRKWGHSYLLGTFLAGLAWGSLALFFDASWPAPYQVFIFAIYTGIIAAAYNTNTPYFIAFPVFYLPPVFCLLFIMLRQGSQSFIDLAGLFCIYIIVMYASALKFHNRLANSLKLRFENEQLAKKLSESNRLLAELADKDELTNLDNRRSMDKYLAAEWDRHLRSQKPLSFLFIDIDYFKQFNDTYGHEGGDQALVKVATILRNNVKRSVDMAARFGGEEFAVILPETDEADAVTVAENIRSELAAQKVLHGSSSVSSYLTVSIGIATMVPHSENHAGLIRVMADDALYKAKEEGRDRIVKGMLV